MAELEVWNHSKHPMAAAVAAADGAMVSLEDVPDSFTVVDRAVAPALRHILPDGTHVPVPPWTEFERTRFFERSVARHGLLREDLESSDPAPRPSAEEEENEDGPVDRKSAAATTTAALHIHPLARASALLQANGINELNRAINLHTLVATGEYFSLSNIVDPSALDHPVKASSSGSSHAPDADATTRRAPHGTTPPTDAASAARNDDAGIRALYRLHRQRDLWTRAAQSVRRHRRRLQAAVAAQQLLDRRGRQWRRRGWRLVAPEHGTRARPHAAAATEVVCADVDVYHSHPTTSGSGSTADHAVMGRLASQVPRYATLQLSAEYRPQNDTAVNDDTAMDVDGNDDDTDDAVHSTERKNMASAEFDSLNPERFIVAQPYVVADPTVAKVNPEDFDATKVTMLTLQFAIENTATGYCERVCIEAPASLATVKKETTNLDECPDDERLLMALQHSLFCAKLFEAMRRELAPDTDSIGQVRTTTAASAPSHSVVAWLTGQSQEGNFLPAPSMMLGAQESGLSPIGVVHVHEGDFKVLLDCEYTLHVQLVESKGRTTASRANHLPSDDHGAATSGSQSPQQLLFLCRALLLYAQETYHRHSIRSSTEQKPNTPMAGKPNVPAVLRTKDVVESSLTLQKCISLGAKLLFEARIRKTLRTVKDWLRASETAGDDTLHIEWLMLSVFDLSSQFTVSFRSWSVDAAIVCDELTVTQFGSHGAYRKVKFHSDQEFELYLKTSLRRLLMTKQAPVASNAVPT